MVIQFGVKEHIKMAETYQWAEEELAKQRKWELELLEDSRRYWQGETADAFRQEHEFMLMEGEYAAYMRHVHGMKEVMEDSIPRFRQLQQMVAEFPTAYGLPCDDEAPETLRLDEEALAEFHEMTDEILRKNRYVCEELGRIMDGCNGLVDFSAERRELEELREDMRQMEAFKQKVDDYADEMRHMDNWMVERLSEFVKIGEGEKMSGKERLPVEPFLTGSDDNENETDIYFLNDYFDSGESYSLDEIYYILNGALLSADITQEEYDNLTRLFNAMFQITSPKQSQILHEIIENEYNRIVERNRYIQMYINEDFLREMGFNIEELGINNFVEELKRGMIQYGITDETSIHMFLATCMAETCGWKLLEINKSAGDAGAGLIQLTGAAQDNFLQEIQGRYDEDSEEYQIIDAIREGFIYRNGEYQGYQQPLGVAISPKEFIAENYPIESAVWFWGGIKQCYTYDIPHETDNGKNIYTINQYIDMFEEVCADREEDLFLAVQYYVNGASLKGPYLEDLCRGWCELKQTSYEPIYQRREGSDGTGIVTDIILEDIRELASGDKDGNVEDYHITHVDFHDLNKPAPNRMEVRFYYYYYFLFLREDY